MPNPLQSRYGRYNLKTSVLGDNNYCLMLWFENEEKKIFDLKPYLNKGVFNKLKNPALFASVRVVAGSIEWSNGLDLSYDTLYLEGVTIESKI